MPLPNLQFSPGSQYDQQRKSKRWVWKCIKQQGSMSRVLFEQGVLPLEEKGMVKFSLASWSLLSESASSFWHCFSSKPARHEGNSLLPVMASQNCESDNFEHDHLAIMANNTYFPWICLIFQIAFPWKLPPGIRYREMPFLPSLPMDNQRGLQYHSSLLQPLCDTQREDDWLRVTQGPSKAKWRFSPGSPRS